MCCSVSPVNQMQAWSRSLCCNLPCVSLGWCIKVHLHSQFCLLLRQNEQGVHTTHMRPRYLIGMQNELLHKLQCHCDAITIWKTWGFARGPSDVHRWLAVASISVSLTRKIGTCSNSNDTLINGFFRVGSQCCYGVSRQNWPCKSTLALLLPPVLAVLS